MIGALRELLARQNRLQRSFRFKLIATIVVGILAIAGWSTYFIAVTAPSSSADGLADQLLEQANEEVEVPEGVELVPGASRPALESVLDRVDSLRSAREDKLNVAMGTAVVVGIAIIVIWLGLALTYLELMLLAWLIAVPFASLGLVPGLSRLLLGTVALAAAFTALIEGVRVVFGLLPGTVFAIARNTVVEAVRMKVSVIFIVLLIFGLAALPGMLTDDSPLRYRVQAFLQYGTGGAFWIIAILTLFFSAATVAFEQRDRQIWQTMTKPVSSWQYVLGKWLGVAGVSATLLLVSTSGVFLFTEYLRSQPAVGEEARLAAGVIAPSPDREILETQVLVARRSVEPTVPPEISAENEQFKQAVQDFIDRTRVQDPDFATDPAQRRQVVEDLYKGVFDSWRTLEPGAGESFVFEGLEGAAQTNAPVVMRYRIDAGSNAPDQMFTMSFHIQGRPYVTRETGLGHTHTMTIAPMIEIPHEAHAHAVLMDDPQFYEIISQGRMINGEFVLPGGAMLREVKDLVQDGRIRVDIVNGNLEEGIPNPETVNLPTGTLEVSYAVGSYRMNYMRTVVILWLKLAFLSMLAITCATFLSFPVACLVAFGAFLAAESAGFLDVSLEYYDVRTIEGQVVFYKVIVKNISIIITWLFRFYANLKPTRHLVEGQLVPWGHVFVATTFLGLWSLILYAVGVLSFRRRELATYSGH